MASEGIAVVVTRRAQASPERAFDVIVPVDLAAVFTGYGPLPAVKGTQDQTGDWNAAGQTRRINLSDGSNTSERIDHCERPGHFAYTVGPFHGPIGAIVDHADGAWWFYSAEDGETLIRWRYTWVPKHRIFNAILWPVTRLWQRYAEQVLDRCVELVEADA
ncbi:MAG: SRPBCC family protein [Solirubrobacterales bacterium]